jgi:hypothetical protein
VGCEAGRAVVGVRLANGRRHSADK